MFRSCRVKVEVGAVNRSIMAAGMILTALSSYSAHAQVATNPNICFQRYLMGAAPKKSSVPMQTEELRSQIDGSDVGSQIGRGVVTGLMGLEYMVMYPPQKLVRKANQNKYKRVSRVIYDAFDNKGALPQIEHPFQVTPEYLRKYKRNGKALQELYAEIEPFKHVHHLQGKDDLQNLIQRASATGAMCPYGTRPSFSTLAALINSGMLEKMVTKAEVEPNYWLLSTDSLLGVGQNQPEVNPFDEISMPASGKSGKKEKKQKIKLPLTKKPELNPNDQELHKIGKLLALKARKLQFKFDNRWASSNVGSPEKTIWKEFKQVLDKIDEVK